MTKSTTADGLHDGDFHRVAGYYMSADGLDPREGTFPVIVTPDGRAFPALSPATGYNPEKDGPLQPLTAERWGDTDHLGSRFRPDRGEFERCGIAFALCGSAVGA